MTGAGVVQADSSCSFRGGPGDREVPSHVALPIRTGRMQHHERGFNGQSQHCGRASKPWATLHRHPLGPEVAEHSASQCLPAPRSCALVRLGWPAGNDETPDGRLGWGFPAHTGSRIRICGQHRYPTLENSGDLGRPTWWSGPSPSVCSVECGSEGEDPAVGSNQPVAAGNAVSGHADDWGVERGASHRAVEGGITEGKDASVGCYEPVALSVGRGSHSIDRLVERNRSQGYIEGGSEGEDPTVTRDFPIPASGVVDRDTNDRLVEVLTTH